MVPINKMISRTPPLLVSPAGPGFKRSRPVHCSEPVSSEPSSSGRKLVMMPLIPGDMVQGAFPVTTGIRATRNSGENVASRLILEYL